MILFFLSVLLLAGTKHWLGPRAAAGKAPSQEQKARLGETDGVGGGWGQGDLQLCRDSLLARPSL